MTIRIHGKREFCCIYSLRAERNSPMKLLTYSLPGNPSAELVGLYREADGRILPLSQFGFCFSSMNDLIDHITPAQMDSLRALSCTAAPPQDQDVSYSFDEILKRAPIPRPKQDVICLGINYAAHEEESARYKKETYDRNRAYTVYFSKRVPETVADGAPIDAHADLTNRLDYEAELALVIGKTARNVKAEDAFDYVFGYTILNDISARELQTRHKQWYLGKGLDGFCPIGPWIATEDEFDRPPVLAIRSYVNDELRQDSHTGLLLAGIPRIIEELTSGMTLLPGTIISTGTPAGVGMGFDPPRFLKKGDIVRCEIDGIGSLTNRVE